MRSKALRRVLCAALAVCLLAAAMPVYAAGGTGPIDVEFTDVPEDAWYAEYVYLCASWGIIDGKTETTYAPEDELTRGEFIKLLCMIGELAPYTMDVSIHWAQPYWNLLNDNGVLWGLDIPLTATSLNTPITRYEMSVMISNLTSNVYTENPVNLDNVDSRISDYTTISGRYQESVVQAYGKGILDGLEDGAFHGSETLTRAQAAAVVVRTGWPSERLNVDDVSEVEEPSGGDTTTMEPTDSFAWQSRNYIDAWGHVNAEGRQILFGDANKSYFNGSEPNLADFITTVQVQTWDINSAGEYYTRTWNLQVNKAVAKEVVAIFEEIYASSERFPIHALGGARYTDTMRHSWGCAIDINPVENYQVDTTTWTPLTGSFCYKTSDSPYCIRPDGIVVQTFAKYGWGWGGGTAENGYTGWTTSADYMHFSILESGG